MKYENGMKRYSKAGKDYAEDEKGSFYKGGDGKMYKMSAKTGIDKEGNKPGQADDHANKHPDDDADYPGSNEKGGKAKKSMISEDDLQKTLDEIEDLYKADDPAERRNQLLAKAQEGDLTVDENEELLKSLRGGDVVDGEPESISEEIVKGFRESEPMQKALDVSEYLDEQHSELVKALDVVGSHIESEGRRQHEFNLILAKAVHQMGTLTKAVSERMGIIETQPVRGPKSQGVRIPQQGAALEKSFGGADGSAPNGGNQMSKGEILDLMCDMMEKSETAPCGESILQATAKYEQTGQMSKALAADIVDFNRESAH